MFGKNKKTEIKAVVRGRKVKKPKMWETLTFKQKVFVVWAVIIGIGIGTSWTYVALEAQNVLHEVFEPKTITIYQTNTIGTVKVENEAEQVEDVSVSNDPDTVKVIKKVSAEYGIDWKLVYAVCLKESGCNPKLDCTDQYGKCDNGLSFGAYQIYNPSKDPARIAMAEDFEQATRWTIEHGLRFKDSPETFFKNHNGLYKTTNQWYVDGAMEIYKKLA